MPRVAVFFIDACDRHFIDEHSWHFNAEGYVRCGKRRHGKVTTVLLHRLITNARPGEVVDHINRIVWDNRRANLRKVSASENQHNRRRRHHGVDQHPSGRWRARVEFKENGYTRRLSRTFDTYEQALTAAHEMRRQHLTGYVD